MRHLRIDVRPEAILGCLQRLPIALWPLIGEIEAHDRFDRLEAVFPRHREAQWRPLLLRYWLAIGTRNEESELIARLCNGETFHIGPWIPGLALAGRDRGVQESIHAHIFHGGQGLLQLQQPGKGETGPWDRHRPRFDAAVAIQP